LFKLSIAQSKRDNKDGGRGGGRKIESLKSMISRKAAGRKKGKCVIFFLI